MLDKTIVVFAAHTSLNQDDSELGLKTYLAPVVEKRLDFGLFKNVNALVREVTTRIQGSNYKISNSAAEEFVFTETSIAREDVVSREYVDVES